MQTRKTLWKGQPAAERIAVGLPQQERLKREHEMLMLFGGAIAPRVLAYQVHDKSTRLVRDWVEGQTLDQIEQPKQHRLVATLRARLVRVHDAGWIHGDIKPENIIATKAGPVLIDWEHAAPLGVEISTLANRAATVGFTHPDLIWARGCIRAQFDFHALGSGLITSK